MERMVSLFVLAMGLTCVLAAPLDVLEVKVIDYDMPEVADPNTGATVFTERGTVIVGDMEFGLHRNALVNPASRWPHGQVPYVINSTYSTAVHDVIIAAMREIEHDVNGPSTCIKFIPRTTQANYIEVTRRTGCHSLVGFTNNGKQEVSIGGGCEAKGTIMHELIHSLGFMHEHNRVDRDSYINIDSHNIVAGSMLDFAITTLAKATTQNTAYDFNSIMHYGPYAFAIDHTKPVITPKAGKAPPNARLGQRINLSPTDVLEIQRLYGCHEDTSHITQPTAQARCHFENSMCSLVAETSPTYKFAYGKATTAAGPYAGHTNGADSFLVIHAVPGKTGVISFHTASFHNGPVCIEFYLVQKGPSSYLELLHKGPTTAPTVFKNYHNSNFTAWAASKTYLDLPAGVEFSITFQAHMAAGDIAIDDLYIYNGHCL